MGSLCCEPAVPLDRQTNRRKCNKILQAWIGKSRRWPAHLPDRSAESDCLMALGRIRPESAMAGPELGGGTRPEGFVSDSTGAAWLLIFFVEGAVHGRLGGHQQPDLTSR